MSVVKITLFFKKKVVGNKNLVKNKNKVVLFKYIKLIVILSKENFQHYDKTFVTTFYFRFY